MSCVDLCTEIAPEPQLPRLNSEIRHPGARQHRHTTHRPKVASTYAPKSPRNRTYLDPTIQARWPSMVRGKPERTHARISRHRYFSVNSGWTCGEMRSHATRMGASDACDDLRDPLGDVFGGLLGAGFDHHPDQRFGARWPQQHAAGFTEFGLALSHRSLHHFRRGNSGLVAHPHIDQHLREPGHEGRQFGKRAAGFGHRGHQM